MQKEYFNMGETASPSPSEGGDVFPQTLLSIEKKPLHQPIYSLSPAPSPNGEGSEDDCLQIKRASCQIEERLSS